MVEAVGAGDEDANAEGFAPPPAAGGGARSHGFTTLKTHNNKATALHHPVLLLLLLLSASLHRYRENWSPSTESHLKRGVPVVSPSKPGEKSWGHE